MLLKEKTILVTGAGQGIGRGIVQALAEDGASVAVTDLKMETVEETAGMVEKAGGRALPLVADVTDAAAVEAAVQKTVETYGKLDGLVNNAGVVIMEGALDTSVKDWNFHFDVNVTGLFQCCQIAARQMVAQESGGNIVNISSNCGKVGYGSMAAYNASKAAVISITRSLAGEWAGNNINVNAVCPGGVATPMLMECAEWVTGRFGGDPKELYDTMTPAQMGRHIQPIEVGRVVVFLLSDYATIIRGQSLSIDGGDTPY
jgi:meso-butanediol dehydrogenase/(S,S)-butanediol dehydrogenase/diacetyl reductase